MTINKIAFFFCILISATAFAQDSLTSNNKQQTANHSIPKVDIKTMSGENVSTSVFDNGGKPIIIDFWATWCKPCVEELNAINDVYTDWKKNTGVKVIVISLDDARTMQRVAPFVNGKGWTYESYIDPNGDFKRAMSVNMPPHTFVINEKKEIVWQHVGFAEGNEDEIYEAVKKIGK
jgi:cytochrome c biogenesis protein CcmG/thiol:disulfide interchange protein DsbE